MAISGVGSEAGAAAAEAAAQAAAEAAAEAAREAAERAAREAAEQAAREAARQAAAEAAREAQRASQREQQKPQLAAGDVAVKKSPKGGFQDAMAQAIAARDGMQNRTLERLSVRPERLDTKGVSDAIRAEPTRGERAAQDSIEIDQNDVTKKRDEIEENRRGLDRETRQNVDDVRRTGQPGGPPLPENVTRREGEGGTVELITRNKKGDITQVESAQEKDGELTYTNTRYKDGRANRATYSTGGELGTVSRDESFPAEPGENPSARDLRVASRDPASKIAISETAVRTDAAGNPQVQSTQFANGDMTRKTETYRRQTGADGIKSDVADGFDPDATTDVVTTETLVDPAGDDEGQDPTITTATSYNQGNRRVTSIDGDNGNDPRQWNVEVQNGNVYKQQQVIEGYPEYRAETTRIADGNTVKEFTNVNGQDENGDPENAGGSATTVYGSDGEIKSRDAELTDLEGNTTVEAYERTTRRTPDGVEVSEHTDVRRRAEDGTMYHNIRDQVSSVDGEGNVDLVSATDRLSGPDGGMTTEVRDGEATIQLNGGPRQPLTEETLNTIPDHQKDMIDGALQYTSTLKQFTKGAAALRGLVREPGVPDPRGGKVSGYVSIAASTASFVDNVRSGDYVSAAFNAAEVGANAGALKNIRAGGGVKGAPPAGRLGQFAKFSTPLALASGTYDLAKGIASGDDKAIAKASVNLAATVGGYAAAGAVGGAPGALVAAIAGVYAYDINLIIDAIGGGEDEDATADITI